MVPLPLCGLANACAPSPLRFRTSGNEEPSGRGAPLALRSHAQRSKSKNCWGECFAGRVLVALPLPVAPLSMAKRGPALVGALVAKAPKISRLEVSGVNAGHFCELRVALETIQAHEVFADILDVLPMGSAQALP